MPASGGRRSLSVERKTKQASPEAGGARRVLIDYRKLERFAALIEPDVWFLTRRLS
jgi:hypothetical protein